MYEFSQEIDTTKSILFKRNMKSLTEALKRQNEAERVLLEAMESLLNQIPDVSNEEVDDINEITYRNKRNTEEICEEAKKKLSTLSSSSLRVQNQEFIDIDGSIHFVSGEVRSEEETMKTVKKEIRKTKIRTQTKTRISCPPKISQPEFENKLYPCLNRINEEEPPRIPPPTYSDSENFYANIKSKSSSVLPSAPILVESQNMIQTNAFKRDNISPSRNI